MTKNINDLLNNLNTSELDRFFASTDASIVVKSDIKETKIDNSWVDVLEDTLPNIDKIVRNPRRFIIQEEDVVIVEKTKKISQETIKHLSEHCENIQDMDKNGDVIPKKLLNVHKEDTTDLYENRFIYTLVKRLEAFIDKQLDTMELASKKEIKKKVNYNATTNIDNKNIKIELFMEEADLITNQDKNGEKNLKDRILSCYEIIKLFKSTEMIKELVGCSLVRNPIRKTNLILREPNFQKAFVLWEYLDNFEFKDPKTINYSNSITSSKDIKDEFTLSLFVDSNAIDESKEHLLQYKDVFLKLNKVIDEYVYEDNNNINDFIEKAKNMYIKSNQEKDERIKSIQKIYNDFCEKHYNNKKELSNLFN